MSSEAGRLFTRVTAVYFSPSGSTETVTKRIAAKIAELAGVPCEVDDFTLPDARVKERRFGAEDLVVFGMPTYAGRLPNLIAPAVRELFHADGALAVPVVLYGNRSIDDSLMELRNTLTENGFVPAAAAAFVGAHTFSKVLAAGRPDASDLDAADQFAGAVLDKLTRTGRNGLGMVQVPGRDPVGPYYTPRGLDGQPAKFLKAKPKTSEACDRCGICQKVCPMGSIDPEDPASIPGICIKCGACIRKCPKSAKFFDDPAYLSHLGMLEKNFLDRHPDPAFFL